MQWKRVDATEKKRTDRSTDLQLLQCRTVSPALATTHQFINRSRVLGLTCKRKFFLSTYQN